MPTLPSGHAWFSLLCLLIACIPTLLCMWQTSLLCLRIKSHKYTTVVWKFFNRKYFIDKKFKVKYFRGCMTSSKYFYLEHISLAIIYAR